MAVILTSALRSTLILHTLSISFIRAALSGPGQLLNFDFNRDACSLECRCYSWNSTTGDTRQRNDRFTVNCTNMKFGLFQGDRIPKPLPWNTTDLAVTDYLLGPLSIDSFDNNAFPLNPQLITLVLHSCHITYLSRETFQATSLQSLHLIDLKFNSLGELREGTFAYLLNVENISVSNNYIQKVENGTFRNLPKTKLINISNNWLRELPPGAFHNVPKLEVLDLSHNWLETVPWESISQLPSLKVLGLKGNLWNCSCQMSSILQGNHSLLSETDAVCLYPEWLNGTRLKDLTSDDFSNCFGTEVNFRIGEIVVTLVCIILCSCLYIFTHYSLVPDCITVGDITFCMKDALSQSGTVFQGRLADGRKVAVKKCPQIKGVCKELEIFLHLLEKDRPHPNIIQYFWREDYGDFTYLALELCAGDLMTAITEHIDEFNDIVNPQNYFLQLTSAICFLHKHDIQHRDIKPQNILWKRIVSGIVLVISDLDLSHFSKEESLHKVMCGTLGWSAPELWVGQARSTAVDIFSLGCVFFFILTGEHPFGPISDLEKCQENIIFPEFTVSSDKIYERYSEHSHLAFMAVDLLSNMTCFNAADRIEASKVREHHLFWDKKEMMQFFVRIGELVQDKDNPDVPRFNKLLEENAEAVFHGNWMDKLDPVVKSPLKGYREHKGETCYLLRVIRNNIVHFEKIRDMDLRKVYLGSKYGVVEYYTKCFPNLVTYTYHALGKSKIKLFKST